MHEQQVIEQLQNYKRLVGRIKILERYPIGNGMLLTTICEDDKLQELHRQLKGMPTYMYLSSHEQELETVAHAYLDHYPLGTKSQLQAVRSIRPADNEDRKQLKEIESKIKKVIEARVGKADGFEAVLDRITELQELEQQKDYIDKVLEVMEGYKPQYSDLLRIRYIEGKTIEETVSELKVAKRSFERWRTGAIKEYAQLIGIA